MIDTENITYTSIPVIPLTGIVAFPEIPIGFNVEKSFSISALEHAQKTNSMIFLATQLNPGNKEININSLCDIGILTRIRQVTAESNGAFKVLLEGVSRAKILSLLKTSGFFSCDVSVVESIEDENKTEETEAYKREIKSQVLKLVSFLPYPSKDLISDDNFNKDLGFLCDFVAANFLVKFEDKLLLLKETDVIKRAIFLQNILAREYNILKIEQDIQKKTKEKVDNNQREYYLREELKVIQSELGNDSQSDAEELYDEIISKKLPVAIKDKLLKELYKFNKTPFGSPEATVLRTYIETCLEIPFAKYSKDSIDVAHARKILDADHYGLEKVKERILEYIAVKQMNPDIKSQILCLVGPPGVGKTSLCSSISKALKKKYVRVSLGGIRDEADIRGHRKTYVGAMPGRIINALIECKTANPVMVLDEIDKISQDMRGDPASALLEVLDGEQNKSFRDHFVELPVDLSRCMFIATANTLDTVPSPLIDRMEIIELSSYTREEKFHIAKNHLVQKQLKSHGLTKRNLKITDDAIYSIIDSYTAEAGVRNLEREISSLCRKTDKEIIENKVKTVTISGDNINKYLGTKKYESEKIDKEDQIGVVNGLAYTSIGGDLLKIEASVMKGNGKLQLTGKLGDVMKESCEIAISFIRENAEKLGINPDFYSTSDIHIHVPEGAVSKDGPSAGVTITTSLVSVLTNRPVRRDIAMTGEITLRGKVLAIGGLKEKSIAGYTAGVKNILIPYDNLKDLPDLDKTVRDNISFIPCKTVFDVLDVAFSDEEIITIINQYTKVCENENKF